MVLQLLEINFKNYHQNSSENLSEMTQKYVLKYSKIKILKLMQTMKEWLAESKTQGTISFNTASRQLKATGLTFIEVGFRNRSEISLIWISGSLICNFVFLIVENLDYS